MSTYNQGNGFQVIISHGPSCIDGKVAAWVIWRKYSHTYREYLSRFGGIYALTGFTDGTDNVDPTSIAGALKMQEQGAPAVFVFVQPSESVPDKLVRDKDVLILDLDMGNGLVPVVQASKSTMLLDHHASSNLTIESNKTVLLGECKDKFVCIVNTNKDHCGATIAWTMFDTSPIPPFLEIVRIGDTWQWNDSPHLYPRQVHKAMVYDQMFDDFVTIDYLYENWDELFPKFVADGEIYIKADNRKISQMAKYCDLGFMQLNDGTVYTVAYTAAPILHSEVGSAIRQYATKKFTAEIDFCVTWVYLSAQNKVSLSLRSPKEGLNLGYVARNIADGYGGGHPEAAGVTFYGIENLHKYILKERPM